MRRVGVLYAGLEGRDFRGLRVNRGSSAKRTIEEPVGHLTSMTLEGMSWCEASVHQIRVERAVSDSCRYHFLSHLPETSTLILLATTGAALYHSHRRLPVSSLAHRTFLYGFRADLFSLDYKTLIEPTRRRPFSRPELCSSCFTLLPARLLRLANTIRICRSNPR